MGKQERIIEVFKERYGIVPLVMRSPGRINLIGEHLDYNSGTVVPAAIDRYIYVAIGQRDDNEIRIFSSDFQDECSASLDTLKPAWKLWPNYILGVINEIVQSGKTISGMNIVAGGDIPLAVGMSSSAALGCATALALNELFHLGFSRIDLAKIAQKSENDFVGVKCGLMDQFASLLGRKDNFVKLDCARFTYEYIPFDSSKLEFVLFDTGVKHHLISSEYNKRREECQSGLDYFSAKISGITSLTFLKERELLKFSDDLSREIYNRCLYILQEEIRVKKACEALRNKDFEQLGRLMFLTHEGLRDLYEVSCDECDFLVECARESEGILGARMMGAGFGGCTINLVLKDNSAEIIQNLISRYHQQFGKVLKAYRISICDGGGLVEH